MKDISNIKNIDSEEALLGSLLIDSNAIRKIINGLRITDFYSERNGYIYKSCCDLYERHESINQISVAQELDRQDKLESCGGAAYLSHLILATPTSLDIENYANIVFRLSLNRQIISISDKISAIGYQANPNINETTNKIDDLWSNFKRNNITISDSVVTPIKAANDLFLLREKMYQPSNYPKWGYYDLDNITAGLAPEYIIIAGRPSAGKTQLSLDIAENLNEQNKVVLIASAEMSDTQIYERKLSRAIGMSILDIRKYGIPEEYDSAIFDLIGEMSQTNIHYKHGKLFLNDIYSEIYKFMSTQKLDAVIIDYLGALQDCYTENKENQNIKIGKVSNKIQSMVHEFKIPIIALSQLNREIEKRADPHPQLSDLRDSGSLEQDADVIFFIHRDKLEDNTMSNILEVTMAKNRQIGAKPPIYLVYNEQLRRYVDYSDKEQNVPQNTQIDFNKLKQGEI